jgi:hypothetical protein
VRRHILGTNREFLSHIWNASALPNLGWIHTPSRRNGKHFSQNSAADC